jgi:hypothetical protein
MISVHVQRRERGPHGARRDRPFVLANFSYRYDAHLVPDLIANIAPMVDGWVSWDDRNSDQSYSDEGRIRRALFEAAVEQGADWILRVDPDERFEAALAARMDDLTAARIPVVWRFHLREMYAPDSYRVDGIWGRKSQGRLFPVFRCPLFRPLTRRFRRTALHSEFTPRGFRQRHSGLNLYHLKMIEPARRKMRRDLYAALDPERRFQAIGYDYLADESGAEFRPIEAGREYRPVHIDDGGTWMAVVPRDRVGERVGPRTGD